MIIFEINNINSLGSKGIISKKYHDLLNQMFNGQDDYISP